MLRSSLRATTTFSPSPSKMTASLLPSRRADEADGLRIMNYRANLVALPWHRGKQERHYCHLHPAGQEQPKSRLSIIIC